MRWLPRRSLPAYNDVKQRENLNEERYVQYSGPRSPGAGLWPRTYGGATTATEVGTCGRTLPPPGGS